MSFHFMKKNILSFLLLATLFYTDIHAGVLTFKAGQKAAYNITQKLDSDIYIFNESEHCQSEARVSFDIEILSVNKKTASYPFDVKITLKKVLFSEIQQNGISTNLIAYDSSSKDLKTSENHLLAEYYEKIIGNPLYFRVEKEFRVKETNGYLAQIHEDFDSPTSMGLFGATPWTYELFLSQLFHLSGENLKTQQSYPTSCYQFLNWEDAPLDENQISIYQESDYIVNSMNSKAISASWQGNAKVINYALFLEGSGDVTVAGNVKWDAANPLVQQRALKAEVESTTNGFVKTYVNMSVEQTWYSDPR